MNTKNLFFLSLLLLGSLFISSCSNEEDTVSFNGKTKGILPSTINSKVISKSEIPEGAKILEVENEAEKIALFNRLSKTKVFFVFEANNNIAKNDITP